MLLKFGATCRSGGQHLGRLHGLVLEPAEKLLLKIVLEEPQAEPLVRVRVPFGRIDAADADQVSLAFPGSEYETLARAEAEAAARRRSGPRRRRGDEPAEQVLTARTKVACRDGEIGTLAGIVVDARSGELESIIVPMGVHVLRDVLVPVREVTELQDETVGLRCDMDEMASHPSLRT